MDPMTTEIATPTVEVAGDAAARAQQARLSLLVFAGFLIPLSLLGY
jgi:hypothetical protein